MMMMMMMRSSILRTVVSGSALPAPGVMKELKEMKELRRSIYSKPPRNKIGAAVSSREPTEVMNT